MRYFILFFVLGVAYNCQSDTQQQRQSGNITYDTTAVIAEGQKITKATFQTLSSNLQNAIKEGGVEHALQFCNVEAIPLTDSLSSHHNVSIRRASHKPRNPYNTADSLEAKVIKQYIDNLEAGDVLQPVTMPMKTELRFTLPSP